MIDMTRDRAPDLEWRMGDAANLPVSDNGGFTVVVCQQGLQFFPDRAAGLAEMRRVLAPGGRLAVSTWRSDEEMAVPRAFRAIANEGFVRTLTMASIENWDWRDDFLDVDVPLLVIHGAGDPMPMESAHEWVEAFSESRLVVLEGAGRKPYLERPKEFVGAIEEFLRHLDP
jgi:pimeloyl-ACP methyl ester carboxylesterase